MIQLAYGGNMLYEPSEIHNSAREERRRKVNRDNRIRTAAMYAKQELTPISCVFTMFERNNAYHVKVLTKRVAACTDNEFTPTEDVKSINHQYLHKLLNALNALNFNISFICTASKIGSKNNNSVEENLTHMMALKFSDDARCLINNIQESSSYLLYPNADRYTFNRAIVDVLKTSINVLELWHHKINKLEIEISDKFLSAINSSINNANIIIDCINNNIVTLDKLQNSLAVNTFENNI